jgi:hypothetical protein
LSFRERCEEIHNAFEDLPGLQLNGDRISPVKHLVLEKMNATREEDKAIMTKVVEKVRTIYLDEHNYGIFTKTLFSKKLHPKSLNATIWQP